jgi:hypothetical protein
MSVLSLPDGTTLKAFADVNTDVCSENTDVRWVGFLPPILNCIKYSSLKRLSIVYEKQSADRPPMPSRKQGSKPRSGQFSLYLVERETLAKRPFNWQNI